MHRMPHYVPEIPEILCELKEAHEVRQRAEMRGHHVARSRVVRWRKVSDLLVSLERIVQTNLVLDTTTKPFRTPKEAAEAERALERFAAVVDRELDRLTSTKLDWELMERKRGRG